ncbi:MAG: phosphoribosylaminoimidazolesuccinocarboxamide synthase [Candidatus Saccharibacteria bacterium]
MLEKRDFIYEGKAKRLYTTDDPELAIVEYKDDATAFDGTKRGTIESKGVVNNKTSALLFAYLEKQGIETHMHEYIDERHMVVKRVEIVPVEMVVRNTVAGSLSKRLGIEEGVKLPKTIVEMYYKNDDLHDPMINEDHAVALDWATREELAEMKAMALKINGLLVPFFAKANLDLIDYKLEFGRFKGRIILADEISPDTCRLWDIDTKEKLDKDRFRRDLGKEKEAYQEVLRRLEGVE